MENRKRFFTNGTLALQLRFLTLYLKGFPMISLASLATMPDWNMYREVFGSEVWDSIVGKQFIFSKDDRFALQVSSKAGFWSLEAIFMKYEEQWWCYTKSSSVLNKYSAVSQPLCSADYLHWVNVKTGELLITDKKREPRVVQKKGQFHLLERKHEILLGINCVQTWKLYLGKFANINDFVVSGSDDKVKYIEIPKLKLSWIVENNTLVSEQFSSAVWQPLSPPLLNNFSCAFYFVKEEEEILIVPCYQFKNAKRVQPLMISLNCFMMIVYLMIKILFIKLIENGGACKQRAQRPTSILL